jgi:hypothetical protein
MARCGIERVDVLWWSGGGSVPESAVARERSRHQLNTALELTLRCKKVQSRRQILFATENLLMLCLTASLSLSYGVTPRLATQRVGAVRMDLE